MDVMRKINLLCATALSLVTITPAFAQQTPAPQAAADEEDAPIIVTATLRNENLQSVPIAVTAFNTESLEKAGVRDIRALDQVSTSFNLNSTQTESGGTTLRVRGVGTTGNNTGLESAVGIFLDGVYLSRPGVALGDLLDVSQVELLRGPQGTLFGRNTSAGALNIKTSKPNLNKFEGFANGTYGNYNLINIQGGVSAPLIEGALAVRLSGAYRKQDGFTRSTLGFESNNRNRYIVRGQLYWEPSADFSLRVIADYQNSKEKCCDAPIVQESSLVGAGFYALAGLPANGGASATGVNAADNRITNSQQFRDNIRQGGASAEMNLRLGNADLVSITGYRSSKASNTQETDFVGLNVFSTNRNGTTAAAGALPSFTKIKTFSQEVRLSGEAMGEKLQYLFGAYYSDERIDEVQTLSLGPDYQRYISADLFPFIGTALGTNPALALAQGINANGSFASNGFKQNGRNISVFTNETFKLSDSFAINLGARYSDDRKAGSFKQLAGSSPACLGVLTNPALTNPLSPLRGLQPLAVGLTCFPFAVQVYPFAGVPGGAPTPAEFNRVFKDNEFIYTGKLTWKPADNINTYISYTHGYKAGGFNLDPTAAASGADPRFNSEKVNTYEFGIKTKLIGNSLTANLAVFHNDLSDFQVLEFTGIQFVTFNVAKAKATGVELELSARLNREFSATGSFTYSNARYPKDCAGTSTVGQVVALCGQTLTNAPKIVALAGFNWDHEINSGLTFGLNGSVRMESDRRTSTQAVRVGTTIKNPFGIQDANAKVNLRAALGRPDGLWRIEFWGNNIFNVQTKNVTFDIPLRGGDYLAASAVPSLATNGAGVARGVFNQEPRTYGLTVRTKF
jgi:iron complex outermembrane recepter protein